MSDTGTTVVSTYLPNGRPALASITKRAYRLVGSKLFPERAEHEVRRVPERARSRNPGAMDRLVHDTDLFTAAKTLCDFIVVGAAHAPRKAVTMLDTGVKVGAKRKLVRAWGDRSILVGANGRLSFSAPQPFTSMPLEWDNAYGGRDETAENKLFAKPKAAFGQKRNLEGGKVAYPRNPAGRGFFIDLDRDRLQGARAPNLEDPEDPVTPDRLLARDPLDWIDRPVAAGYGPIDHVTFPRAAFFLSPAFSTPTRPVREVTTGFLRNGDLTASELFPTRVDPRAAQCACPELQVAVEWQTRLSLWNLWPGREVVDVELPPEVPGLVLQPKGCSPAALTPSLRTVLIEPEQERVTLTWGGALEVAAAFPDEACREMRHAVQWPQ